MPIYKGSTELTGIPEWGTFNVETVAWGDKLVVDPTPPPAATGAVDVQSWTGTGSQFTITTGFRPCWLWITPAAEISNGDPLFWIGFNAGPFTAHNLEWDRQADSGWWNSYDATTVSAFSATGYTVETYSEINTLSNTEYRGIAFKDGGVARTLSSGSITTTAYHAAGEGYQMISYTGTPNSSDTLEHDVGGEVEFGIVKKMGTSSADWTLFGTKVSEYFELSNGLTPSATTSRWVAYLDAPNPFDGLGARVDTITSSLITIGNNYRFNHDGYDFFMQLFTSVAGKVKVGIINAQGGSVHTESLGFQPAFIYWHSYGEVEQNISNGVLTSTGAIGAPWETRWYTYGDNAGTEGNFLSTVFTFTADGFTIADGSFGNDSVDTTERMLYCAVAGA